MFYKADAFKKDKNISRGFTLIELLLYLGLFSVIVGSISLIFIEGIQQRAVASDLLELQQQGAFAMDYIKYELTKSVSVTTPTGTAPSASLVLVKTSVPENPTTISLVGAAITSQKGVSSPVAVTGNAVVVTGISFKNLANPSTKDSVQISFTLQKNGRSKSFISTVSLR